MNPKTVIARNVIVAFIVAAVLAFMVTIILTGCSAQPSSSHPDPKASVAEAPKEDTATEDPAVNPMIHKLGEVMTYTDGVSISVSKPVAFTPTEYAFGNDQKNNVAFTIVLTNGTDKVLEPGSFPTVSSGGVEGSEIIDSGNKLGDIGYGPTTGLLPGQTIKWVVAFSIADLNNITLQVSPSSFKYQDAIFTNIEQ